MRKLGFKVNFVKPSKRFLGYNLFGSILLLFFVFCESSDKSGSKGKPSDETLKNDSSQITENPDLTINIRQKKHIDLNGPVAADHPMEVPVIQYNEINNEFFVIYNDNRNY